VHSISQPLSISRRPGQALSEYWSETAIEAVSQKPSNIEPLSFDRPYTPPYNIFRPLSEGDNDVWPGPKPNTCFATSPITLALDAAADDLRFLPPLPDNPLDFARYETGTRYSFDTSVRPLIQSRPDSPIGGTAAAPMAPKQSVNIGTAVIKTMGKAEIGPSLELPPCCDSESDSNDAKTKNHPAPPCCDDEEISKSLNNQSEPRSDTSESEAVESENRPPLATKQASAPASGLSKKKKNIESKSSKQIESKPKQKKPRIKHTSKNRSDNAENMQPTSSGESMVTAPKSPQIHPNDASSGGLIPGVAVIDFAHSQQAARKPGTDSVSPTSSNIIPEVRNQSPSQDSVAMPLKDLGSSNQMKALRADRVIPNVPTTDPRATLSIPIDATGELPSPPIPGAKQNGKPRRRTRYILLEKGKRTMRKGRKIVLRRPVLIIILGRQLAGPTSDALRLISDGVPIDPSAVTANVKPAGGLTNPG